MLKTINLLKSACIIKLPTSCSRACLHVSSCSRGGDGVVGEGDEPQAKFFPVIKTAMLPPGTFEGRTALVTGGGTGLGRVMAAMLSGLGADVIIASRRREVVEATAAAISAETGRRVVGVSMDVRRPDEVAAALDVCQEHFTLPHIIINNAAGNFISPTERLSSNAWRTVVDIVLNGTANVTMEAGKRLIAAGQGCAFLAITTPYTRSGSAFVCPSASAKAGVEAMTRSLSSEWGRHGIRLNCLAPGPIETEGAFSRLDPTGQFKDRAMKGIPAGRFGEPEEVANLACFLVSDYASWLSGETVCLDGGQYRYMAGMFSGLSRVTNDQWDLLEQAIRASNAKEKGK